MTTPEIKIPTGELQALLQKSILDALSAQTRETMLATALKWLMEKPEIKDNYSYGKKLGDSPLEVSFHNALRTVVDEVAKEIVIELKPQIAEQLRPMVEAVGGEYDWDLARRLMQVMLDWAEEKKNRY